MFIGIIAIMAIVYLVIGYLQEVDRKQGYAAASTGITVLCLLIMGLVLLF